MYPCFVRVIVVAMLVQPVPLIRKSVVAQDFERLAEQPNSIYYLAVSPDGRMLASSTVSERDGVRLWNVETRSVEQTLHLHKQSNFGVCFSPDGKYLVSMGELSTGMARVWDIAAKKCVREIAMKPGAGTLIAFSPDSKTLIASGSNEVATYYELATGKETGMIKDHMLGPVYGMALSPDGTRLATGFKGVVVVWDMRTGKKVYEFAPPFTVRVGAVAFSPDGKALAAADRYGLLVTWDMETGKETDSFNLRARNPRFWLSGGVRAMAYTPDGSRIALTGNGRVALWDVARRELCSDFSGLGHSRNDSLSCLVMSPDGKWMATTGDNDKRVIIWKIPAAKKE